MEVSKDLLAENALLASIFDDPEALDYVSEIVQPEDFYEPANATIYEIMLNFRERGKAIHPIGVTAELKKLGELANVGGIAYITELTNPSSMANYATDADGYALLIKESAQMRKIQKLGETIIQSTQEGSNFNSHQALALAEDSIFLIGNQTESSDGAKNLSSVFLDTVKEIEQAGKNPEGVATGIPSGFIELDAKTNGFHPQQLITVGARPAIGKSTIAVDFARHAALLAGKTVLMFSLEMSKKEILMRIISAQTRIPLQDIRKGNLTGEQWNLIAEVKKEVDNSNFLIDDFAKINLGRIRSTIMKQKMKPEGLDMVLIDYLQLIEITSTRKNATRENDVSELSRGLKLLAKEFDIPIIILAQLNRGSENRTDKTPQPSDLRESGSIEQDSDVIILLHRPEIYNENDRPGEADLILAKQRNGPIGKIGVVAMLAISKFANGQGQIPSGATVSNADEDPPF